VPRVALDTTGGLSITGNGPRVVVDDQRRPDAVLMEGGKGEKPLAR
jgi:hypothetical protein